MTTITMYSDPKLFTTDTEWEKLYADAAQHGWSLGTKDYSNDFVKGPMTIHSPGHGDKVYRIWDQRPGRVHMEWTARSLAGAFRRAEKLLKEAVN